MVKSWTDKLNNKEVPQLEPSPRTFSDVVESDSLRVPTARQVEEFMRGAPLEHISPFWRVLDETTPTTGRLTFGADFVRKRRNQKGLPD